MKQMILQYILKALVIKDIRERQEARLMPAFRLMQWGRDGEDWMNITSRGVQSSLGDEEPLVL